MNEQNPCPWAAVISRIIPMKHIEFEILGFLVQQPVPLATVILNHISYTLPQPLKRLVQMVILNAGQVVASSRIDLLVGIKIRGFPVLQAPVVISVALVYKA